MQSKTASIRNKLMAACALVMAAVLAAPAAMAHDGYRGHGDHSGDVLGALVVGAVIGGVLASASHHHDRYYDGGYAYPAQPYPSNYYGSYPAYAYGNGGYYGYPGYGGGVSVGVVYSNRGGDYDRRGYDRSRRYYGNYGHDGRGDRYQGGRGHYYDRHGH